MKNDRIENLKIFENLKDNENYSKLSIKLNRLFKNNSIENFYKNLYEDKKYIISNPLGLSNEQIMNNKFFYNLYKNNKKNNFNIKKFKQYLKNLQIKEDNKNKKNNIVYSLSDNCLLKKNNNNINNVKDNENNENNDDNNLIKPKNKKIRFISESPGIGRYNLNYSLVFKRVKNVFFGFPSKKPKLKKITIKKNNNNDKNFNFSNYKKNISLDSENINNENTNLKTINHCLKFENYTNRKPLVNVIYKNDNLNIKDIKKDIKKNNNLKKKIKYNIISFDKMSKRNYSFILKNDVPPIGKYSPNYNLIYSHKPIILIDKNKNNKNNKKYQANKILHKIDVPTEYEIITKLNKKNN